jgi:endonuclease/exonuclease/phosphatase family metal-dependent hydrolase
LDVDGVLALAEDSASKAFAILAWYQGKATEPSADAWAQLFDAGAVANLLVLHEEFRPQYVISSSWRRFFERNQIIEILARTGLGLVAANLHTDWRTRERLRQEERVLAVSDWLARNYDEGPVLIIDDLESGWNLPRFVEAHPVDQRPGLVRCDPEKGFDAAKLQEARDALAGNLAKRPAEE